MGDRRIQVFATVVRHLSFTKAAEILHMTQPAVTFQIRQLEEHFNTRLFDRTHNRISLTEAGTQAHGYAKRIVDLYKEMDDTVRRLTGEISGLILIGASSTIADYLLPNVLGKFQERYPEVKFRLSVMNSDGIVHMVESNEVDIGAIEAPIHNKQLAVKECWQDSLVLVCHPDHDLAKGRRVRIKDVLPYPFVGREEGSGTREFISDYMNQEGTDFSELNLIMEFGTPESIKCAVEGGIGISIMSEATVAKEVKHGTLRAVPLDPPLSRPFSIVYQPHKFRARGIEEFLAFTTEVCEQRKAATG